MTWTFLISSKAVNILAPMFIAKATDALAGEDPARAVTLLIAGYASLLFANKAFKELQSLSYIRVKLIASVQLKESIFAHLLTLSMLVPPPHPRRGHGGERGLRGGLRRPSP